MALLSTSVGKVTSIALNTPHRYKIGIQYNGAPYRGWQTQPFDGHEISTRSSIQAVLTVRFTPHFHMLIVSFYGSIILETEESKCGHVEAFECFLHTDSSFWTFLVVYLSRKHWNISPEIKKR